MVCCFRHWGGQRFLERPPHPHPAPAGCSQCSPDARRDHANLAPGQAE